jgi:hypothetical protein
MEGLAPTLKCLIEIQSAIQNGETIRAGILHYLKASDCDEQFSGEIRRFLFAWDQGHDWRAVVSQCKSPQRKALFDVMAVGFQGVPVQPYIADLRNEMVQACEVEVLRHLEVLPVLMLVPLLIFQFPAFLLLLFGPLLGRLAEEISK